MSSLDDKLAALAAMPPAQLRAEWLRRTGAPAGPLTPDLLRRALAWRLQAKVHGGLPATAARELERIATGTGKAAAQGAPVRIRPGTRLVRDWGGVTHHVEVLDGGFLYAGERHRSLSTVARTITGARWSGPRFFGLTRGGADA